MYNALTNEHKTKVFIQTKEQARNQAIVDMHDKGFTGKKIALVLGIDASTVSKVLKKNGRAKTKTRITKALKQQIVELRKKGISTRNISTMLWVSQGSVSRILIAHWMRSSYHRSKSDETIALWEYIPPRPKRTYIKKHPKRNKGKTWFRGWLCKAFN